MKYKRVLSAFIISILISVFPLTAETDADPLYYQHFNNGSSNFSKTLYPKALEDFQQALKFAPENEKGTVYYWIGQCYMAIENYSEAEKIFNHTILNYPESRNYSDSFYQKGRINFIKKNYEQSIESMNSFLETSARNHLTGSAFYWIGESLFNLGHRDKALQFYRIVTENHKSSYKYEASKYMIELIRLSGREEELIKLLKLSHEESLKEREIFIKKENEYTQAILSYQRKLAMMASDDPDNPLQSLREANNILKRQIELQNITIQRLNTELEELKKVQPQGAGQ